MPSKEKPAKSTLPRPYSILIKGWDFFEFRFLDARIRLPEGSLLKLMKIESGHDTLSPPLDALSNVNRVLSRQKEAGPQVWRWKSAFSRLSLPPELCFRNRFAVV